MKNKFSTRFIRTRFIRSGAVSHGARGSAQMAPAPAGFTLIELLIVIATIAILAALLMPVFAAVSKHAIIQRAQSERDQIETAIERYHSKYGFYPPGNAIPPVPTVPPTPNFPAALTNQLYYELVGTTNIGTAANPNFLTLDNRITNTPTLAQGIFGVSGFMNCSRGAGGEDAVSAQSFLTGLKSGQLANVPVAGGTVSILCTAAKSDPSYQPIFPGTTPGTPVTTVAGQAANPWRYLYPGVNNPQSYDLWIQIFVGGKTNLICNWKTDPQINSPLP